MRDEELNVVNPKALRVRTITFGTNLPDLARHDVVERALAGLNRSRQRFADAGYEVQTIRIALPPVIAGLDLRARERALSDLQSIDAMLTEHGVIASLGPLLTEDRHDRELSAWTTELVRTTRSLSFSCVIAAADGGIRVQAAKTAADIMVGLSQAAPGGLANFRFAAAANVPAGTPFFPVAWHDGNDALAIGLESAGVVLEAWSDAPALHTAETSLNTTFNRSLVPLEKIATESAERETREWLGIDTSPAPGGDRSIAAAIERLIGVPFGSASTLNACATITAVLKSLNVKTCGYSGLMLPVLEDPLLAQRAAEQRYGIRDLLLYSSVCGTGLDVVPIAGDTSAEMIAGLLTDVAALSVRLRKPLSARLLLIPGKRVGDHVTFDDPLLHECVVMKID